MSISTAQWAAGQADITARQIAGDLTESEASAELLALTLDWSGLLPENGSLPAMGAKVTEFTDLTAMRDGDISAWSQGEVDAVFTEPAGQPAPGFYPIRIQGGSTKWVACPAKVVASAGDASEATTLALAAAEAAQEVVDAGSTILAAKDVAVDARSDALAAAEAFESLIDWDTLDLSVLFRFLASGRRVVGSVNLDSSWDILLASLRLASGAKMEFFESLDESAAYLFQDATGRTVAQLPDPRVTTLASTAVAAEFYETLDPAAFVVMDPDRRIVFQSPDPALTELIGDVADMSAAAVTAGFYETLDAATLLVLDPAGREVARIDPPSLTVQEVIDARGSQTSLGERLDRGLTPHGDPVGPYVNAHAIRNARMVLFRRLLNESGQLHYLAIGNSYTQGNHFIPPLSKALQTTLNTAGAAYGMAGMGWVGFGFFGAGSGPWVIPGTQPSGANGTARRDLLTTPSYSGDWTGIYNNAAGDTPDICSCISSTPGSQIVFAYPTGHNGADLFYTGDGTGVVKVSWDNGATWSADIALNTAGAAVVALGAPLSTLGTFKLEVVSGNVRLGGVNMKSAADGIRFHKLGGSGSSTQQWASVSSRWGEMLAALVPANAPCIVQIELAGNDHNAERSPSLYATDIAQVVENVRAVLPSADIMFVCQPNLGNGKLYPMTDYTRKEREYAVDHDCALVEIMPFLGLTYADYAPTNPGRPWMSPDTLHLDPATGDRAMASAVYRFIVSH